MFVKKKHIVWVILLTFLFSLIPINPLNVSANDNMNIVSSTNITVSTAKKWAKSKGATNTFVELADLYWKYSSTHGNVNPAVAYVQAAKETGYGKFGGVIDESYHNPCGMKTSSGGGDYDPNAHMRFKSWDEGVQAHLDHLALYAGAKGYPRTGNTHDPRHFASIRGKAPTVVALGGNWAPSVSYGQEILVLYRNLEKLEQGKGIGAIDEPSNSTITTDNFVVSGWALNTKGIAKIDIYVDNILKATVGIGQPRPDVKEAYPNYSEAAKSGFSANINISDISNGTKVLRVEQIGNDGSKNILTKNITINRVMAITNIDTPAYNANVGSSSMKVSGWAINKEDIKAINIYVNDVLKGTTTTGISRLDVQKVYPNFPKASTSGFSKEISLSGVAGGKNRLKVEQVTNSNKKYTVETVINVNKPEPITCIDTPVAGATIKGNSLTVSGWSLNNDGIKAINIYVDGVLKGTTTVGLSRLDVQKYYPQYTNASKSGFSKTIDISNVGSGTRTIKVEQVSDSGKMSKEVKVKVEKPGPITCIDAPSSGKVVSGNTLTVSGWAINGAPIKDINIYVDGVLKKTTALTLLRPDVKSVYTNYVNAEKSGFSTDIDISNVAAGNRVIKVEQVTIDGSKSSTQTTVRVDKLNAITCIDTPVSGLRAKSSTLTVSGWAISNNPVKTINVYVDGVLKGSTTNLLPRPDVKQVYSQYKNAGMSGYNMQINIADLAAGNRILKVEQVASDGSKHSTQVTFTKLQPIICLDQPSNGKIVSEKILKVSGWAINNDGVNTVNIYVDGVLKKTTQTGLPRPDVQQVYREYENAAKSGFSTDIDISNVADGQRIIKVEQVAGNGKKTSVQTKVTVVRKEALMALDAPVNNSTITSKKVNVRGWALNPSGIKSVEVYVDGVKKATTTANLSRPDVHKVYPGYGNSDKCGYSVDIDLNTVAPGKRTIKVVTTGNDGRQKAISSVINLVKKASVTAIDSPADNYLELSDSLTLTGWTLNDSGVKSIEVGIDGIKKANITATINRPDVIMAYPNYQSSSVCGFTTKLSLSGYSAGAHTVSVKTIGYDGTTHEVSRRFYYKTKPSKVIVVDPGHNNGGDEGAIATVNKVTYYERVLNDEIAFKTGEALKSQGYTVFYTRQPFAVEYLSLNESLAKRVNIANSLNADLFISIHNNTYEKESANGTEVLYTSKVHDSGYSGPSSYEYKLNKSRTLATTVCNNIANAIGFTNRGAKDQSTFVCRNTNMPAILVECGFISNHDNATKLSNASIQTKIADAITRGVKSVIG